MARLVTAEAGGESYKGKVAVAKVILNRVNAKGFPNTITGVIYEPIKYGYAFTLLQMEELISLQAQKQNGCRRGYLHKWSTF